MSIQLYEHNQITYENMCLLFNSEQRVAVVQPTGTGKSFLYLKWIEEHLNQNILVVSPSHYIFQQLEVYQEQANIAFQHVSYMTYARLAKLSTKELELLQPDFLVLDEFHRCGAPEWGRGVNSILEYYPQVQVLGTSATPIRYLDSCRDMAQEVFHETYAVNMSIAEAMEKKILPTPIYVASYYSFLGELESLQDKVEQTNNEKLKLQLYNKIKKAKHMLIEKECSIQEIFKKHMTNTNGKYIVFCSSEERLDEAMGKCEEWFHGMTSEVHRYKVLSVYKESKQDFEAFAKDEDENAIKLLFCVDMLNEGIHVEDVEGVIMLRTTESLNVYYQQLGRALTCVGAGTKRPIIFDLVNNFENGNAGSLGVDLMSQLNNGENEGNQEVDFQVYDYILDLRKTLEDIRNTFEMNWDYNYESVKNFLKENGRFPYNREVYHGIDLGSWCIVQRRQCQKGTLYEERKALLNEIGFSWDPREALWQSRYDELEAFVKVHGRTPKSTEKASLYIWISKQKKFFKEGELCLHHEEKLRKLGVEMTIFTAQDIWNQRYKSLCEFKEIHDRLPHSNEQLGDIKIGSWLVEQRNLEKGGNLDAESQEKLEIQGVVFQSRKERAFWENLELLQEFLEENKRFPNTKDKYRGFGLGVWCSRVREDYKAGNLNQEQIQTLINMNFDLRTTNEIRQEERWEQYYSSVKEFVAEHGHLPKGRENQNLYWWIKKQRQVQESGKLSKEQVERLKEIV